MNVCEVVQILSKVEKKSNAFTLKVHHKGKIALSVKQAMQTRAARKLCARAVAVTKMPLSQSVLVVLMVARSQFPHLLLVRRHQLKSS
jgi:hypothetical protein